MQLDLQSVETFQYVGMSFCPENVSNWSSSPQSNLEFSPQDLPRAASSFSRGPVAGNHRQHFFDPAGSNTITISDRIENNVFLSGMGL